MKKLLLAVAASWLAFAPAAYAANVNIDGLPAAASVAGANLLECEQSGTNNKCTATQMAAFIYGLMSGDATASGTGAVTFPTVNSNVGSFGSTTQCVSLTVTGKGLITAASAATCAPAVGSISGFGTGIGTFLATPSSANLAAALTDETGTGSAVFATSPTLVTPVLGTPSSATLTNATGLPIAGTTGWGTGVAAALANPINATSGFATYVLGSSSAFGLVKVDNTTITATAGVISAVGGGSGTVTSVAAACGASSGGSPITTTGTISAQVLTRANTGTTDTILAADCGNRVTESNAGAVGVTLPQAVGSFTTGYFFDIVNLGAGTVTITPTTSTINGTATLTLAQYQGASISSDGTNYSANLGKGSGSSGVASLGNASADTSLTVAGTGSGPWTGTVTAKLNLGNAQTWTAAQTFTNSDFLLLGSSTGATTFTSANAGASNFTLTLPAATDQLVGRATTDTLTNKSIDASEVNSSVLAVAQLGGSAASHGVPVDVAGTSTYKVLPNCTDTGGNHINYTQSTDAFSCGTSGGASNTEPFARPAYITGGTQWYLPHTFANGTTGVAASAGTIKCTFGGVPNLVTLKALAVRISTLGTSNIQIAVYQDNAGVPGTLLGSTASIVDTGTGIVQGNIQVTGVDTPIQVGPGGSVGNDKLWWCTNSGDATIVMLGLSTSTSFGHASMIGSATIGNLMSGATTITGKSCTGAACQGGSSTFGTWPADLHTSTFSDVNNSSAVMIAFLVN